MVFESLKQRLIIEGYIEALTPLHVGAGGPELTGEPIPVIKGVGGRPYIPGSSIKGKVRSEVERLARSLGLKVCSPPDVKRMCGSNVNREDDLCVACRIFGTAGGKLSMASKVKFRDAFPEGDVRPQERPGVAIDRDRGAVEPRRLYTLEVVPEGTRFRLEVVCENIEDHELKMLMSAMVRGLSDTGLGGHVSRGLGKVRAVIERVRVREPKYYLGMEDEKVIEGAELQEWLEKMTKLTEDDLKKFPRP